MLSEVLLSRFAPFNGQDQQFLARARELIHVSTAKKGTIIFKRGKELADHYFLLEGDVHLINSDFSSEKVSSRSERAATVLNELNPSKVSAIAKTPVKYFTINAAALAELQRPPQPPVSEEPLSEEDTVMEVGELAGAEDWMSSLLQSPLFERIPMSQLQELFLKFETIELEAGEVVVKEGSKGDYFYVLAEGTARVTDRSGSIDVLLRPGQYFGEEALISAAPRNASVKMEAAGVLKRLNAEDFTFLVKTPVLQYLDSNALSGLHKPYKVLDVRLPLEFREDHVPGSINVPLSRLRNSLTELAYTNAYAIFDRGDGRADIAAYLLCQAGFDAFVLKSETKAA